MNILTISNSKIAGLSLSLAALLSATSAHASLNVPAGNSLVVNDTDLNVAWTQDANLFKTQAAADSNLVTTILGLTPSVTDGLLGTYTLSASDFNTSTGAMNWWGAQAWVNYLNNTSYAGLTDWRLPQINPVNGISLQFPASYDGTTDRGFNSSLVNSTASELAHLYYNELGNTALFNTSGQFQAGAGVTNSGPFTNLQGSVYWFGAENTTDPNNNMAWVFATAHGGQGAAPKINQLATWNYLGWAVRPGQVSSVPVPGAVWLMGSALVGLLGVGRRNASTLRIG